MDLALNNVQRFICHKPLEPTNQNSNLEISNPKDYHFPFCFLFNGGRKGGFIDFLRDDVK